MPGFLDVDTPAVILHTTARSVAPEHDSDPLGMLALSLGIVALVFLAWLVRRRRHHTEQRWAAARNWTYVGVDDGLADRWRHVFGLGGACRVSSLLIGPTPGKGVPAATFELGDGYGWRGYRWHVVTLPLPAELPLLELTPEVKRARTSAALGSHVIAFESARFNTAWRVQAPSSKYAHDVLQPRLLERLLLPDARGLSIRIEGSQIACWRWGPAVLGLVDPRLDLLGDIVDAIPRFVWLEHGYDPGPEGGSATDPSTRVYERRSLSERLADWWAVSVSSGPARRRRG